jgi:uncharacterized lipoprotein YajG
MSACAPTPSARGAAAAIRLLAIVAVGAALLAGCGNLQRALGPPPPTTRLSKEAAAEG